MSKTNENDFFDIDTERYSWDDIKGKIQKETWALLYGNGMSINFYPEAFSYDNISKKVKEQDSDTGELIDKILKENNIEKALLKISEASQVVKTINCKNASQCLEEKYTSIQEVFIKSINVLHPYPDEVIKKLTNFKDFILTFQWSFTTNYDLLTYWALFDNITPENKTEKCSEFTDFFTLKDKNDPNYVRYNEFGNISTTKSKTNIYYLHGALHIFSFDYSRAKKIIRNPESNLLDLIQQAINQKNVPLCVTEGDSESKYLRIISNNYLHFCIDELERAEIKSILIFGHSLEENDAHLFNAILQNKNITDIWYGIHITDSAKQKDEINKKIKELEDNAQKAVKIHGKGKSPKKKSLHIYISNDLSEWLKNP